MNWDEELAQLGISPLSEADVLSKEGQYTAALQIGYSMRSDDGEDYD